MCMLRIVCAGGVCGGMVVTELCAFSWCCAGCVVFVWTSVASQQFFEKRRVYQLLNWVYFI